MIISINGSNYGDEGKGLATDFFASKSDSALVVRHNGGAQSGHTVEIEGKRFVFHELSSGSFRGADTYWAETFFPDIFKLGDEVESFKKLSGVSPKIFASPLACLTTIDDVLINMLLETSRKDKRHGSCGMGINEADLRKKAGFGFSLGKLVSENPEDFYSELLRIRKEYTMVRLSELGLIGLCGNEYIDMLTSDDVLMNFAEGVFSNLSYITLEENAASLFKRYDDVIFEAGQGLLLDAEFKENWPHVTASRTGLTNVIRILDECSMKLDKVIYVTRSYITKHGAGPLKNECEKLGERLSDYTNIHNEWQGSFRYARFDSISEFIRVIEEDMENCPYQVESALFVTHLNETDNNILLADNDLPVKSFVEEKLIKKRFDKIFLSASPFGKDVLEMRTDMNTIVNATKEDKEEILALYKTMLYGPADWNEYYPSEETIEFDLERDALFVMKNEQGEIIAAISIDKDDEVEKLPCWNKELAPGGEFSRLCVKKEMQNQGIAKRMVQHVINIFREQGKSSVHILVKTGHDTAKALYSSIGFEIVGNCSMFGKDFLCMEMRL